MKNLVHLRKLSAVITCRKKHFRPGPVALLRNRAARYGSEWTVRRFCYLLLVLFLSMAGGSANAQNAIVTENAKNGNPASEWDVDGAGDLSIQGFATDISVNKGERIHFKIKSGVAYTIDIYRLGYYGGNGA